MKPFLVACACCLLGACASQLPVRVLEENDHRVAIQGTVERARAQEAADRLCAQHQRRARFNQVDNYHDYIFDCIDSP